VREWHVEQAFSDIYTHSLPFRSVLLVITKYNPQMTEQQQQRYLSVVPNVQNLLLKMESKGAKPKTIAITRKTLTQLAMRCDLNNTAETELTIARYKTCKGTPASEAYKMNLVTAYRKYCKVFKIQWGDPPSYRQPAMGRQMPTRERIITLISAAHGTLSTKIAISYATGLRPCEIVGQTGLRVKDIHPDNCTLTARIQKGCNPRPPIKIPETLMMEIQTYIQHRNLRNEDLLFKGTSERYGEHFIRLKHRIAKTRCDPEYLKIRLYDLRHAYITGLLRKTQNAEIVRQLIGHKHLDTTQKYLHLAVTDSPEWIVEYTNDKNRAKELLLNDFTYQLTTPDGYMLFKKPK
jgi:integrase